MNPEFQRQLWLQFSPLRLILMPALLALGVITVFFSAHEFPARLLADFSLIILALLLALMGSSAVSASVLDELNEGTWDQQRMSATQPWAMTWGKLFGASAYAWYGAGLCLLIYVLSASQSHWNKSWQLLAAGLIGGIFLHSLSLLSSLLVVTNNKQNARQEKRSPFAFLVLGVLIVGGNILTFISKSPVLVWWGRSYEVGNFLLVSLIFFSACALLGAWRQMAANLAVRQYPWVLPLWMLLFPAYTSGFFDFSLAFFLFTGLWMSVALCYLTLLMGGHTQALWQRIIVQAQNDQYGQALQQLPVWFLSFVLAVVFALALALVNQEISNSSKALNQAVSLIPWTMPLLIVGLLLRDICLLLFLSFKPQAKRALSAFWILLILLNMLWFPLEALGLNALAPWVSPYYAPGKLTPLIVLVHVAMALFLLIWRWRQRRSA